MVADHCPIPKLGQKRRHPCLLHTRLDERYLGLHISILQVGKVHQQDLDSRLPISEWWLLVCRCGLLPCLDNTCSPIFSRKLRAWLYWAIVQRIGTLCQICRGCGAAPLLTIGVPW